MNTFEFKKKFKNFKTPNTYADDFGSLRNKPGVYALVYFNTYSHDLEVLYIGSSKNLKQRHGRHEVLRILKHFYNHIMFYFLECDDHKEMEVSLIQKHKPKFNNKWH